MPLRRRIGLVIKTLIFVSIFFFLHGCKSEPGLYLQLYSMQQEKVVKEFKVETGDKFYLDYIHSSEKTPIHDVFEIDENENIILVEEQYHWYAVGLESNPEYESASIVFDGKVTRVKLNRLFPVLLLRVGWVAEQVLTFQEEEVNIKDLTEGGDLLQISVVHK
ncbi:hypothetical protein ES703_29293 [subsurface metagenome]